MKTLRHLAYFFLMTMISCLPEPDLTSPNQPAPVDKYKTKGYYLDGQYDDQKILIQDTAAIIIGPTSGASTGPESDSVTLSFGTEFRIIDATGKPLETFKIDLQKKESTTNLDSNYNYRDLTKIDGVITEGLWDFCYNGSVLKDKGVSVQYTDHRNGTRWYTESFYHQMFDYSTFKFEIDKVVNNSGDQMMIVEGSLQCTVYNFDNPEERKDLTFKFRGPIKYYYKR